jgi:DeoR/GlpR family transcriptional regulator of sugar metabolism
MRISDISTTIGVSAVSVRKALSELEKQGIIQRFHGVARLYAGDDIPFRMHIHFAEKQAIANAASVLVENGETILLEAGSAVAMLAEKLKSFQSLTVITTNIYIARIFRRSKVQVIVLGGIYQDESESLVGPGVVESLKAVGFSKAFLGISGVTVSGGFMLNDLQRAEITKAILERSKVCKAETWFLTDSSKFGVAHAGRILADNEFITGVITDSDIPEEYRVYLNKNGIRLITVEKNTY